MYALVGIRRGRFQCEPPLTVRPPAPGRGSRRACPARPRLPAGPTAHPRRVDWRSTPLAVTGPATSLSRRQERPARPAAASRNLPRPLDLPPTEPTLVAVCPPGPSSPATPPTAAARRHCAAGSRSPSPALRRRLR